MTRIAFTKMVGTGNDFMVVDTVGRPQVQRLSRQWPALARAWCDRHRGVGADGVLVLEASRKATVRMRVFNADGSEAEMCGNGARCVARYLHEVRRGRPTALRLETRAGVLDAGIQGAEVTIQLTQPKGLQLHVSVAAAGQTVQGGFVNTGVPHFVVPVRAIDDVDVAGLGRTLRHHAAFAPRGANVNFIQADAQRPNRLWVRTYERGVEAETLACGTGITASAIIHLLRQATPGNGASAREVQVQARSGDVLSVAVRLSPGTSTIEGVTLRGAARRVFEGAITR